MLSDVNLIVSFFYLANFSPPTNIHNLCKAHKMRTLVPIQKSGNVWICLRFINTNLCLISVYKLKQIFMKLDNCYLSYE